MTNLTQIILTFEEKYDAKWTDNIQHNYSYEIDFIIPIESIPNLLADISKIKTNKTIIKCIYEEEKYYISIDISTIKKLLNDISTIKSIDKYMKDIGVDVESKGTGGTNPYLIHFSFYDCSNIIDGLVLEVVDEGPECIAKLGRLHYTDNAEEFINNIDFTEPSYNDVHSLDKRLKENEYENIETIKSFLRRFLRGKK